MEVIGGSLAAITTSGKEFFGENTTLYPSQVMVRISACADSAVVAAAIADKIIRLEIFMFRTP